MRRSSELRPLIEDDAPWSADALLSKTLSAPILSTPAISDRALIVRGAKHLPAAAKNKWPPLFLHHGLGLALGPLQ